MSSDRSLFIGCRSAGRSRDPLPFQAWVILWFASLCPAQGQGYPPNWSNPAFANNVTVHLAVRSDGQSGIGTRDNPLNATGERFDRIMQSFRGVPNVTFILGAGDYETFAKPEFGDPRTPGNRFWEPYNYWKIIGAGVERTVIRQVGVETDRVTKHSMIWAGRPEPGLLRHFEMGHLTLDARGEEFAPRYKSNFGCISIDGSDIHIHDVICKGSVNAQADDGVISILEDFRELFILRLGVPTTGPFVSVSNNLVERCVVINSTDRFLQTSTNRQGQEIVPVVTAIINAGHPPNYSVNPRVLGCFVEGRSPTQNLHAITVHGCIRGVAQGNVVSNAQFAFYRDSAPTESVRVISNSFMNVRSGVYFNSSPNQGVANTEPLAAAGVWGNSISLSDYGGRDPRKTSAVGISFSGNADPAFESFRQVIVGANLIQRRYDGGALLAEQFFAMHLAHASSAWIYSNRMDLSGALNPLLLTQPRQPPFAFGNHTVEGGLVLVSTDGVRVPDVCGVPPGFERALVPYPLVPVPLPVPAVQILSLDAAAPGVRLFAPAISRIADQSEAPGLMHLVDPALEHGWVSNQQPGGGSALWRIDTRNWPPGDYYVWVRVRSAREADETCWAELDGEEFYFDTTPRDASKGGVGWRWTLLHGRTHKADNQSDQPRLWRIHRDFHDIRIRWEELRGLEVDHLLFTQASPSRYAPSDVIARLGFEEVRSETLSPWSLELSPVDGRLNQPVQVHRSVQRHGEECVEFMATGQGSADVRFAVPRAGYYSLSARVKSLIGDPPSCYASIDGGERILRPEPDESGWHWIGESSASGLAASARSESEPWIRYLAVGPHTLRFRSRVPGLLISKVRVNEE
ncbi:MAG: hypothetical protein FJ405_11125 [Verrucomicrobia bacterium]|nr:hypothetical protein [Verrucomicrobiota bacterium]